MKERTMPKKGKSSLEDRLHRVQGQLNGVEGMIERGEELPKILAQLQASISSLESLKLEVVRRQIHESMQNQVLDVLDLLK